MKTLSLSENHRFRLLYARGRSKAGRLMVVYCMRIRPAAQHNRLGLTVSKKLGKAVTRNRIRRRLREAYRLSEDKLKTGYDIIIVARHGCENAPFGAIERELLALCSSLELTEGGKNG